MTTEFRRGRLKIKLRAVLPGLEQPLMMLYTPPTARLPGYEMATLKGARHTRRRISPKSTLAFPSLNKVPGTADSERLLLVAAGAVFTASRYHSNVRDYYLTVF